MEESLLVAEFFLRIPSERNEVNFILAGDIRKSEELYRYYPHTDSVSQPLIESPCLEDVITRALQQDPNLIFLLTCFPSSLEPS